MRKQYYRLSTLLFCATLLIAGCTEMRLPLGSGNIVREERTVAPFTAVSICCGLHLEWIQGEPRAVVLEGDDNILSEIETVVEDEQLTIRFRQAFTFFSSLRNRPVTIIITAPTLQGLELSGGAEANADQISTDTLHLLVSGGSHINIDTLSVDQLSAELSGGAEIRIDTGTINQQKVDASGGSHYRLDDVQSSSATLQLSGGSQARVWVSETLRVNASGGSQLDYTGSPTVEQNISGGSRVHSRGE